MDLNREQVLALAETCHIALTGEETAALTAELNELLMMTERLTGETVTAGVRHDG